MTKIKLCIMALVSVIMLTGCGQKGDIAQTEKTIGISMHNASSERWAKDCDALSDGFKEKGYLVDARFTKDGNQKEQILDMIDANVSAIVVTADDPTDLADVLEQAQKKDIKVIAYDRLPTETEAVDALVTFDSREVGRLQAQAVEDSLKLKDGGKGSIVMIGGSKKDSNAAYLHEGALSVLQPYFDSGVLTALDGKTTQEDVLLEDWSADEAKKRMIESIENGVPDVVICGNDTLMSAVAEVVEGTSDVQKSPVFIGQDCSAYSVAAMKNEEDVFSVFKDTTQLAELAVEVTDGLLGGNMSETDTTLNNGKKDVPTYFYPVVLVSKENVDSVLPESKKIAVIRNLANDDHTKSFFEGAQEKGNSLGFDVKTFSTGTDDALMQQTMKEVIDSGEYAGILISHGKEEYSYKLLKQAADQGIKIVTFDTVTKPIDGVTTTAQNDEALARLSLDALIAESQERPAKLVKVWYDEALAPFAKRNAVYKEYEDTGKIKTVAEIYPKVTSDKLRDAVKDEIVLLKDVKADGIWAARDELAKGVYDGLDEIQKTDIPMVSIDLSETDKQMMKAKPEVWCASAYVDAKVIGETCMELLNQKLSGKETPAEYSFEAVLASSSELE